MTKLREEVERCRRLAKLIGDEQARAALLQMANECAEASDRLERKGKDKGF